MSVALKRGNLLPSGRTAWRLPDLSGRLVELSGASGSASFTLAFGLVREAQFLSEPVVWITRQQTSFFPPDAAEGGVDVGALAVVRVLRSLDLVRAADSLARSGAFGLLVIDLADQAAVSMAAQSRLLGLAQKHDLTILFLTRKPKALPSLGSLISLRGQSFRRQIQAGRFECGLKILKDKRRAPGWSYREVCVGPAGLY